VLLPLLWRRQVCVSSSSPSHNHTHTLTLFLSFFPQVALSSFLFFQFILPLFHPWTACECAEEWTDVKEKSNTWFTLSSLSLSSSLLSLPFTTYVRYCVIHCVLSASETCRLSHRHSQKCYRYLSSLITKTPLSLSFSLSLSISVSFSFFPLLETESASVHGIPEYFTLSYFLLTSYLSLFLIDTFQFRQRQSISGKKKKSDCISKRYGERRKISRD
jgi:hypothetical protein